MKFGRLLTSDGRMIGSEWIRRNKDWSRINYTVLVSILCKCNIYLLNFHNFYLFQFY
jgi:hypothetical protein